MQILKRCESDEILYKKIDRTFFTFLSWVQVCSDESATAGIHILKHYILIQVLHLRLLKTKSEISSALNPCDYFMQIAAQFMPRNLKKKTIDFRNMSIYFKKLKLSENEFKGN